MKSLVQYILESQKFLVNKHTSNQNNHNYHPQTRDELKKLVKKLIEERGLEANLNDIDTSAITDMDGLFMDSDFDGDISNWDVSNVEYMKFMFAGSKFTGKNGDISNWDISNVKYMNGMFFHSKFNSDISNWNVKNVITMSGIFYKSPLENNPPNWYK